MSIYFLIDCNSFFCSCERLFRPELRKKAVGVLSSNDGCFVARSNELKKIGVKMGEPYFKVKSLCDHHQVALFSSNFSLYANLSDRVMKTLQSFSEAIEVYSIDEAFLEFSFFKHHDPDIDQLADEIKQTVERHTGIPVSIGIGATKTLAKVANHYAKKQKKGIINLLASDKRQRVLRETFVRDVWGIGAASAKKLNEMGLHYAYDLTCYDRPSEIQKKFSIVGLKRYEELKGISHFKLNEKPQAKKGIMRSRSFSTPITDFSLMKQVIAGHVVKASEKLREQHSVCATIEVYIRTSPFNNGPQHRVTAPTILTAPSQDTRVLIKAAHRALEKIFKNGFAYRKAGVYLSNISPQNQAQMSLFEKTDDKSDKLMHLIDHINQKKGAKTISFAVTKPKTNQGLINKQHSSPHYVTKWHEIAKVY